jgi:hypothetical protein
MLPEDAAYLFGDQVCARREGDDCIPTPGARMWVEHVNKQAGGGHCEGLAVLSAAFFTGHESVEVFGGNMTHELPQSDDFLLRTIIALFVTQFLEPVQSASQQTLTWTRQQVVDHLVQNLTSGDDYPHSVSTVNRVAMPSPPTRWSRPARAATGSSTTSTITPARKVHRRRCPRRSMAL